MTLKLGHHVVVIDADGKIVHRGTIVGVMHKTPFVYRVSGHRSWWPEPRVKCAMCCGHTRCVQCANHL